MLHTVRFVFVILLLLLPLSACGGGTSTPSQTTSVKTVEKDGHYFFEPASISVAKGATVTWTNSSDAPHIVSSDSNAFADSKSFSENQTVSITFNTAGTFAYHCKIHPDMKATITVTG
jgi:plastocyanin